ncbi:MAG TPA: glycosyltransferase family 4 protein [Acidobacteriota bacterium]|nr:glycosyltransferase family 4 protein [Acidobacteriota bacterium]
MRILFLNDSSRIAGAEKSLALLAEHLDGNRFQKLVVCPPGEYPGYLRQRGVEVRESQLYYYARRTGITRYIVSLLKAFWLVRSFRPDIIHCNSYRAAHWGIPLATVSAVKTVCHIRDARYTRWSSWLMKNSPKSVRFIAISEAVRQALLAAGVKPERIDVIHNCADLGAFHPAVAPDPAIVAKGKLRLGVFGRIEERKRLIDAVEAVGQLDAAREAHLFIAGEAWTGKGVEVERELRARIRELGLEQQVTFLGYRNDVPEIMAALDIVLMPAVDEPFARVVLEGMCMGKPVIGILSGGVPEVIENGVSGILAPPRSPRALAEAIESLVKDPGLARRLGENARRRALEQFSVESHLSQVEATYRKVLGQTSRKKVAYSWIDTTLSRVGASSSESTPVKYSKAPKSRQDPLVGRPSKSTGE